MKFYKLMHRDDLAAILEMDDAFRYIRKTDVRNRELMPLQAQNDYRGISRWWEQRQVPKNQNGLRDLLTHLNLTDNDTPEFLALNLGLSLNDCYWIQPLEHCLNWNDVSLFTNSFRSFSVQDRDGSENTFSPASSTGGELEKRWISRDGKQFLVKGNAGNSSQQSLNEIFAGKLHQLQGVDNYVSYEPVDLQILGKNHTGIGCISENFSCESLEFIPAIQIVESQKKRNDISWYEHYINVCIEHGIDECVMRNFMDYMLLSDYLITNTDRHFMNFGVLRDSVSLRFVKPAPIFDSGNSMFCLNRYLPDFDRIAINSFARTENKQLSYVRNRQLLDIQKIPGDDIIENVFSLDPHFRSYESMMLEGYHEKIRRLQEYLSG